MFLLFVDLHRLAADLKRPDFFFCCREAQMHERGRAEEPYGQVSEQVQGPAARL